MPKVKFVFADKTPEKTVDAQAGESLLQVALRSNIPIANECGGCCSCATCHVKVQAGDKNLSFQVSSERSCLKNADNTDDKSRLACQTKVNGDTTVLVVNKV